MKNQFSENLKKIRKEHNLSQEQLADELGVSRQAISKWESSVAYPEMDKIIALCDKFNFNIDDLLHKDIKQVKEEEESKKSLNKTIDDFLKFITDTIDLFSNMNFKSKIKCLFEQMIIIFLFTLISIIIIHLGSSLFLNLLEFLPDKFIYFFHNFFNSILILFCIISSIIILIHVFKTRYLDYYNKLKKDINNTDKNIEELEKINNQTKPETIDKKNKILFKKNENKIIIRDPKHSEYRFINRLLKLIIGIIKFFAFCMALFIALILVSLFVCFILSFLLYKTGLFFIGLLITIVSSATITTILLLIILNFILNRKNEKKKMIWSVITSFIVLGCGVGLIFVGALNFEVLDNNETMLKKGKMELEMKENTFFNSNIDDIQYVEKNQENITIEYSINKYYKLGFYNTDENNGVHLWAECNNPIKLTKEFINNINNRKIIPMNNELSNIVIYASQENIQKIKENEIKYFDIQKERENLTNYYLKRIDDLESKIDEYEIQFAEYEDEIAQLNSQIEDYKEARNSNNND